MFHERQLQKNFVAFSKSLKQRNPITTQPLIDIIMQVGLYNIHNHKATLYIIEGNDILNTLVQTPFFLNAPINKELLELLFVSQSYNQKNATWISDAGIIRGINATWYNEELKHNNYAFSDEQERVQALMPLTSNTDAIALISDPMTQLWTIVIDTTIFKQLSAHHAAQLIKKQLNMRNKSREIAYEKQNRTTHNARTN
jgi:hypothetical protein